MTIASRRQLAHSPLTRLVARVLILALVAGLLPLEARAVAADPTGLTKTAFGELLSHTGSDPQPYAFTGEPYDPNVGFQYHRARWMDPSSGRFLGMDTSGGVDDDPPTLHKYLYAGMSPVDRRDPTGRDYTAISTLTAVTLATTVMGAQLVFGLAVIDQVIYGGDSGLKSLLFNAAIGAAAGAAAYLGGKLVGRFAVWVRGLAVGQAAEEIVQFEARLSRYWTRAEHLGQRVYQRNDLIDPHWVDALGRTNLQRMKSGLAPLGPDGLEINLHHLLQTPSGPIAEVTQTFHQGYRDVLHVNPPTMPSGIDRNQFRAWKRQYWKERARHF